MNLWVAEQASAFVTLGAKEWFFVALSSVIIFGILGRKIVREIRNRD